MATLYCSPSGGGSGADFNNLATLPNTTGFTRGNTYVIVGHASSYGNKTLSTVASGTTQITIRKANAAQDGAVAGWSSSFASLQATFGSILIVTTYWVINGVTRTETNQMEEPAGYGIRVDSMDADSLSSQNASFSEFSYLDVGGAWSTASSPVCAEESGHAIRFVYDQTEMTFTRCCFHNRGADNSAIAMMHGSSHITWDHCDFYMGWGKATIAAPNTTPAFWTVRYCRFWNSSRLDEDCGTEGGGITCELGAYTSGVGTIHEGHLIYGNVFYGTASGGRNSSVQFGDGNASSGTALNCKAYNNTFAGFPESASLGLVFFYSGSGNEVRNSLVWDTGSANFTANTTSNNVDSGADPFLDYAGLDFRLSASTADGFTLSSPYDVDPLGNIRGAGGNWDVGAYQFETTTKNITFSGTLTVSTLTVG